MEIHIEPRTSRALPRPARSFAATLLLLLLTSASFSAAEPEPRIPKIFEPAVAASCRQTILVLSPNANSVPARLWMLERAAAADPWRAVGGSIPVTLGKNGLAWGDGEHTNPAPAGFRIKKEGDGCSPAGVFRIPSAFGYAPQSEAGPLKLPYLPLTSTLFGVDDPQSRFYNQVVDTRKVAKDWQSAEIMRRDDVLYRWGAFVSHNSRNEPSGGSCIFLHIWKGPGKPTSGCTAMAEAEMKRVLAWLDPAQESRLVQGLETW